MRINAKIEELTRDELVELFSTGLYGNDSMCADYTKENRSLVPDDENRCFEETLADILLAGGKIQIMDCESEGELYGDIADKYIEEESECGVYNISLEDVKRGFENIISNNYKTCYTDNDDISSENTWLNKSVRAIISQSGENDMFDAWGVLQVIVFNEVIYG